MIARVFLDDEIAFKLKRAVGDLPIGTRLWLSDDGTEYVTDDRGLVEFGEVTVEDLHPLTEAARRLLDVLLGASIGVPCYRCRNTGDAPRDPDEPPRACSVCDGRGTISATTSVLPAAAKKPTTK